MTSKQIQQTDLPAPVEAELNRITWAYGDAFRTDDVVRDLLPFLRARPQLVREIDPGGPPPSAPDFEAHLEAVARVAVQAWDAAYVSHGPADGAAMTPPPWMRGLAALFDQIPEGEGEAREALVAAIHRAVAEAAAATGLGGDQVLELYRQWSTRRMDLINRVFAYEGAVHERLMSLWGQHPKGDDARLEDLFDAGLVDARDLLDLAQAQGLEPAPGVPLLWPALFPGRWVLAADAREED